MRNSRLCALAATLAILLLSLGCARKADTAALPAAKVPETSAKVVQAVQEAAPLSPGDFMFIRQKDGLLSEDTDRGTECRTGIVDGTGAPGEEGSACSASRLEGVWLARY